MELKIVSALQRAGSSEVEIFAYFNHYELPKYMDEGKSRSWLQSLITASNTTRKSTKTTTPHLRVIGNEHNTKSRHYRDGMLVHRVLRFRAAREKKDDHRPILTEWWREIIGVSSEGVREPVSVMTARRMSAALIDREYVRLEPLNKKSKLVRTHRERLGGSRTRARQVGALHRSLGFAHYVGMECRDREGASESRTGWAGA